MWKGGRMGCGGSHGTSPSHGSTLHDNLIRCLGGLSVASVPSLHRYQNLEEFRRNFEVVSNKVHLNCVTISVEITICWLCKKADNTGGTWLYIPCFSIAVGHSFSLSKRYLGFYSNFLCYVGGVGLGGDCRSFSPASGQLLTPPCQP